MTDELETTTETEEERGASARVRAWLRERVTRYLDPAATEPVAAKSKPARTNPFAMPYERFAPGDGRDPSERVYSFRVPKEKFAKAKPKKPSTPTSRRASPSRPRSKAHWNAIEGLSVEKINELRKQGLTAAQIGERFSCTDSAIYKRLREHREKHPELYQEFRVCPSCGDPKQPAKLICSYCSGSHGRKRKNIHALADKLVESGAIMPQEQGL